MINIFKLWFKWILFWFSGIIASIQFLLSKKIPKEGLTILCYHRISDNLPSYAQLDPYNVTPENFSLQVEQCRYIRGLKVVSARNVRDWIISRKMPKGSYLLFTFDDGYQNIFNAVSKLYKNKLPGVFFLATSFIDKSIFSNNHYDIWLKKRNSKPINYQPLTLEDCNLLLKMGFEIQSHSHTHRNMGMLSIDELTFEINKSKEIIKNIGIDPNIAFAYPYGSISLSEVTQDAVDLIRKSGISFAVTTDAGFNSSENIFNSRFKLKRMPVQNFDRGILFKAKAAGYTGLLPHLKKFSHKFINLINKH